MQSLSNSRGRTLTEVVVTLAILLGALAVAIPELSQIVNAARLRSGMYALMDGLRLTRNEAIRRNGRVVMCKTSSGLQCTKLGDWSQGWIVFHDPNNSGDVSVGEEILYREPPMTREIRITGNQTVDDYISYTSYGRAKQLRGGFQAGTLTICNRSVMSADAYQVIFGKPGRPRVNKTVSQNCK